MSDNLFDRPEYDPGFYHVPQYYEMDPTSDELLFDGGELEDGMIVLIENPGLRVPDVDSWLTAYGINLSAEHIDNLRVWNRWCEVTDLVIDPEPKNGHHCTERMVRFVGVYADDVKRKRVVPYDEAWLRQRPAEPIKIVNDVPNIWYRKKDEESA